MREGGQYACAVTGILLATPGTAVIHTSQHTIRIEDNLVTAPAFDMRDEPDATAVPFQGWTVEAVRFGQILSSSYIHMMRITKVQGSRLRSGDAGRAPFPSRRFPVNPAVIVARRVAAAPRLSRSQQGVAFSSGRP